MEEDKTGGVDSPSSSRISSSFEKLGDRIRFTVELKPGETTIVSWKKLLKDATKANAPTEAPEDHPQPPVTANAHTAIDSVNAQVQPAGNDDAPHPNRFSAVIEKIERLYMGKDSSDEDLDEVPDDDQYDTEDSFIDDAELDEYFEVDKSKTKHEGFFVNRGKLESIEPSQSSVQQPKKRRRKEMSKAPIDSDEPAPNKHMKVGKKGAAKISSSLEKNSSSVLQSFAVKGVQNEQNQLTLENTAADAKTPTNKLRDAGELFDAAKAKHHDKGNAQCKHQIGKKNNTEGLETSSQQKEKYGPREQLDLNLSSGKPSLQTSKNSVMHKKEGSSMRPKINMLEKAIRELEKMVAESRPPISDIQDVDASSQAIKRRLPREIKLKLAKVAKIAQASQGKISNELLSRLMSIVGHVIQLRTLKRHLKVMINTSLTAKQEKDKKFQVIKAEVVEMIRLQAPSLMSKAIDQQLGGSDDFQETGCKEKGVVKGQYCMDAAIEDKICDLYDIFVDGLEDDATPQIRKLYAELAELWPKGVMDNHGIKRAVCHAKERRRGQERIKVQDKIKRKKLVAAKMEESMRVESSSAAQTSHLQDGHGTTSQNRFPSGASTSMDAPVAAANPATLALCAASSHLPSAPNYDRSKLEKVKGVLSNSSGDAVTVKKKVKKRLDSEQGTAHSRPDKIFPQRSDDRHKPFKPPAASIAPASASQKSKFQSLALPSSEQLT